MKCWHCSHPCTRALLKLHNNNIDVEKSKSIGSQLYAEHLAHNSLRQGIPSVALAATDLRLGEVDLPIMKNIAASNPLFFN
jgi:hypothetical protein